MTTTLLAVGRSGDKPKQPRHDYLPPEQKRFIIEVAWWTRLERWPEKLLVIMTDEHKAQHPPYESKPVMRENRYCETAEEALAFVDHCKKVTVLNRPGIVVKMTWEIYGLDPVTIDEYLHPTQVLS